jgi:hypothetical protein
VGEARKKAIGSGSGALVTTAIGVYLGRGDHPHIAMSLYVAAALCAVYVVLQWPLVHKILGLQAIPEEHDPPQLEVKESAYAGRDNTGTQFGGGNLIGDSAIEKFTRLAQQEKQASLPLAPRPKPNLVCHKITNVEPGRNYLFDTVQGDKLFLLPIENQIPAAKAGAVVASLRFHQNSLLIGKADRIYWYDKSENEIGLERNETQNIVLGLFKQGQWHYFHNPTRHIQPFRSSRPVHDDPDPPKRFPLNKPVSMTVEVFNPYSEDGAYIRVRYLIVPTQNGCEIGEA